MKQPNISSFSSRTPEAVSMPDEARPIQRHKPAAPKPNDRTDKPNGVTERSTRTVQDNQGKSVLEEMNQGVVETGKRPTERYSFEIYTDQKQRLRDLKYQYEKRTGNRLSTSRIIREAIEFYLRDAL